MSLGDCFPAQTKRASVTRQLVPGAIIKIRALMDDGKEHEKRYLVVHVDENTIACVINSEIHRIIQSQPNILKCQVEIKVDSHAFMERDSHIDCSKVWNYQTEQVISQLANSPEWIFGQVISEVRDQALAAIKCSPLINPIEAGIICASLAAAELE